MNADKVRTRVLIGVYRRFHFPLKFLLRQQFQNAFLEFYE